jgi:prephenate dehydrogenase
VLFSAKPELGLIGYGRFGRLAGSHLSRWFRVLAADRRRIGRAGLGVRIVPLAEAARQPIVVFAVPVNQLRATLRRVRPHLREGALVLDVCAVKTSPMQWMEELLPPYTEFIGMHPLFGPDSAADTFRGRTIVVCPGRISPGRLRAVLLRLRSRGLRIIVTTPQRHDRFIAETLFLPQYVGRSLAFLTGRAEEFQTPSSQSLLRVIQAAKNDSEELLRDIFRYAPAAVVALRKFERTSKRLKKRLSVG